MVISMRCARMTQYSALRILPTRVKRRMRGLRCLSMPSVSLRWYAFRAWRWIHRSNRTLHPRFGRQSGTMVSRVRPGRRRARWLVEAGSLESKALERPGDGRQSLARANGGNLELAPPRCQR
jgi:hypothetical protein